MPKSTNLLALIATTAMALPASGADNPAPPESGGTAIDKGGSFAIRATPRPRGVIGVTLDKKEGAIVVSYILPGGPAAAQPEIHVGDRVLAVGQDGEAPVPVAGMSHDQVLAMVRGNPGSQVSLTLAGPGEDDTKARTVSVTRKDAAAIDYPPALGAGDIAPAYEPGVWISGEPVRQLEKGTVYFIDCWAAWCGPCVATIPHVERLHRKYSERGLVVIGQDIWEADEAKVRQFVTAQGDKMSYRVAMDRVDPASKQHDGPISEKWVKVGSGMAYGIPVGYLVGKDGKIVWSGHPKDLTEATIAAALAAEAP